jgi:hypothetical protein
MRFNYKEHSGGDGSACKFSALICFMITYCLAMSVIMGLGIYITVSSSQSDALDNINLNRFYQI